MPCHKSIIVCVNISIEIQVHAMSVLHIHCPTQYSVVLCHSEQTMRKQLLTSLTMSSFTIENNNADVLKVSYGYFEMDDMIKTDKMAL
jgi:hypothetical protein